MVSLHVCVLSVPSSTGTVRWPWCWDHQCRLGQVCKAFQLCIAPEPELSFMTGMPFSTIDNKHRHVTDKRKLFAAARVCASCTALLAIL